MPAKPVLNVRLAPETLRKLDAIAAATRRTRSFVANDAIEAWVDREIEIIEDLRLGLEEVRAGKGIPHDRVMREMSALLDRAKRTPRRGRSLRK